jgi:2-deoxy-D-gluconate 3-dehydrogenase
MILDEFRLDGKTALVTGCRRGIGKAMATALAEAGADIIGVSQFLEISGSEIEKEVHELGRKFNGYTYDLSQRENLYNFIEKVRSNFNRIDILVNNAGINIKKPALEYPDENWDKVMEVNLNSQFILAREFGSEMVKQGGGKIVFTASLLSFQGGITVPAYAAAKSGIKTLTMALANEWASMGVNVNAIAPGYIKTELTDDLRLNEVRNRQIVERIPAGRWGEPDDFKGAIVFLCSDASNYINGTTINVDGGWMGR